MTRQAGGGVPEALRCVEYRRLDYWCRRGYLQPQQEGQGSGTWRVWPDREVRVALHILDLLDEGLTLRSAAYRARREVPA